MNDVERSVLWHRLISEVDLLEYYDVKQDFSFEEQLEHMKRYGKPKNDHHEEIRNMREQLIQFSERNPVTINEAPDILKDVLMRTLPRFLDKYPQYKEEACIK